MLLKVCLLMCLACCVLSGTIPDQIQSRIVGGQQDNLNQFPWHASIQVSYNNNPIVNNCGGSIISTTFILTSADCILNAKSIKINVGSNSFSKPGKTLTSTAYFIHPQYNTLNFQNNIALVKLPSALVWSATISAIRLVARSQGNSSFYNNEAYLTGFGRTQTNNNTMSERLQWVKQRIISNQECLPHFQAQMIQPAQVCTMGWDSPWQASCFGDGGGALVVNEFGTWTQIAVMSFIHLNGCQDARPTGFVRVSSYFDWIGKTAAYSFRP